MSELARSSPVEVDFLAALRVRGLLLVGVGALAGATAGFSVARSLLMHHEARAVLRIGTIGLMGPVLPLSEVRARAESRSLAIASLTAHGAPNVESTVNAYKVLAEIDPSRDGTVVTIDVVGPEAGLTLGLAQDIVTNLQTITHAAYTTAMKEQEEHLSHAVRVSETFGQAALAHAPGSELVEQTEAALEFERWAAEVAGARQRAQREVVVSRDTDVIDPPYTKESNARAVLVAALGAFAGMLLGLAIAVRPSSTAA